jgi:hypothetical protein
VEEIVNMTSIAVVHAQVGVLGIQQSTPPAAKATGK